MRLRSQTFESMLKQDIGWYDRKENNTGTIAFYNGIHLKPPHPFPYYKKYTNIYLRLH